jgi:hypothetical protein
MKNRRRSAEETKTGGDERAGGERLSEWPKLTAPQLELQGRLSRYRPLHPLLSPKEWFPKP